MTGGILTAADDTGSGEKVRSDRGSSKETSGGVSDAGLLNDVMDERLKTMLLWDKFNRKILA